MHPRYNRTHTNATNILFSYKSVAHKGELPSPFPSLAHSGQRSERSVTDLSSGHGVDDSTCTRPFMEIQKHPQHMSLKKKYNGTPLEDS